MRPHHRTDISATLGERSTAGLRWLGVRVNVWGPGRKWECSGRTSAGPRQVPVMTVPTALPWGGLRSLKGLVSGLCPLHLPARSCPHSSRRPAAGRYGCPAGPPGLWGFQTPAAAAAPPWPAASGGLPREPASFEPHPALDWSPAFPPSHRFWFPLRQRPEPACKGQACSFRDKRKSVPAPWACPSLSPAQRKGEAGGPFGGQAPQSLPAEETQVRASDCSLGLERKLFRGGMGWKTEEEGGRPALGGWRWIFH